MYTQCPECLSVFLLEAHALAQARGAVICGHCSAAFDSFATLAKTLPPEPFRKLPLNDQALQPPRVELVIYRPTSDDPPPADEDAAAATEEDFSHLRFTPRFVRGTTPAESRRLRRAQRRAVASSRREGSDRHWPWVVAGLLLTLVLGGQLAWAQREPLLRNPLVGGWLRSACAAANCELPLVSSPHQLRLLASNVQAHPSVSGALMISVSIRNDAIFSQPFPVLMITLSDAQGHRIAMRRLQPREYLDDTKILKHGLAPEASAALVIEVKDPGDKAVAFEFDFG